MANPDYDENGENSENNEDEHLTHRERMIAARAWERGFHTGVDAGARMMENGGIDDDDVNPYSTDDANSRPVRSTSSES
jgi:hypothetical protein